MEMVEGNEASRRRIRFRETGGRGSILGRSVIAGRIDVAVGWNVTLGSES